MKVRFGFGDIKNLVCKLQEYPPCLKGVLLVLFIVTTYCYAPFFFLHEPLNVHSCIGWVFDNIFPESLWDGEKISRNLVLDVVCRVLLALLAFTILFPKLGFRLAFLIPAAAAGLFLTVFLVPKIEYAIKAIGALYDEQLLFYDGGESSGGESSGGESNGGESSSGKQNLLRFRVNLTLLVMSLPVFLVLWVFRTYDTYRQIEKSQEQIKESVKSRETSIYNNLLSTGLDLIASDNVPARCIGLVQLALVRRESPALKEQIDASTQDLTLYKKKSQSNSRRDYQIKRGNVKRSES